MRLADPLATDGLLPIQSCLLDFIVLIGRVDGSAKSRILLQYRSRGSTRIAKKFSITAAIVGEPADDAVAFDCSKLTNELRYLQIASFDILANGRPQKYYSISMSQVEILPWPLSAGHPTSESRVAEALRDSDLGDDWIVLHSLNLSDGSTRKKWCEADFVIIGPPGILVIEVKGGRIKTQSGSWYSIDKNNVEHRIQDPAEQAKTVAFGMATELAKIHPELLQLLVGTTIGFSVSFPDVDWTVDAELLSLPKILIADCQKVRKKEIGSFVRNAMAYWVKKLSGRTADLSPSQRAMLRQALRPDFDLFQSLAATGERVMETQVRATEEQYRYLDIVQRSPRVCFEGGAGTGKSFVALEACRRLSREGKSVAMFVRSKPLATSFARELKGLSARVLTSDAIDTHTDVYDALIVDEGQDLLQHATLDALNRIVRYGLEGGRWYWFMDVNRNSCLESPWTKNASNAYSG